MVRSKSRLGGHPYSTGGSNTMIAWLSGVLRDKSANLLVLDVGGVGYEINIPITVIEKIGEEGDTVSLHIQTVVREDAIQLFGFADKPTKNLFIRLTSVTGIGPKLAITILSGLSPEDLLDAIRAGNLVRLSGIPGIGKKTAERLVVELRDYAATHSISPQTKTSPMEPISANDLTLKADVVSALVNLGWQAAAAEKAVAKCFEEETRRDLGFLLKQSMKHLYR